MVCSHNSVSPSAIARFRGAWRQSRLARLRDWPLVLWRHQRLVLPGTSYARMLAAACAHVASCCHSPSRARMVSSAVVPYNTSRTLCFIWAARSCTTSMRRARSKQNAHPCPRDLRAPLLRWGDDCPRQLAFQLAQAFDGIEELAEGLDATSGCAYRGWVRGGCHGTNRRAAKATGERGRHPIR